ncbi:MAG TPA: hypothetical protein VK906_10875 [Egicoccus sp.]|nr:hypothetical protein [Egicoccus sp.]HSK23673.1 hypothetical protein [Egicoccus sp.]
MPAATPGPDRPAPGDAARLRAAKEHARAILGDWAGVRGLGIGDGCVRVYVSDAAVARDLPDEVDGVRLESVEVGDVTAHD